MAFRFLFPQISIGPNAVNDIVQTIPAFRVAELAGNAACTVRIERILAAGGAILAKHDCETSYANGAWSDPSAFDYKRAAGPAYDWRDPAKVAYLETSISMVSEGSFSHPDALGFYTAYPAAGGKTFFSDNVLKYGDRNVITTHLRYGTLVACYPTCRVDLDRDISESIIFFNPYRSSVSATVELEGTAINRNIAVPTHAGLRVDIAKLLPAGQRAWWGTVFVTSKARPIFLFCKHSASDPNVVTTVEHSLAFYSDDVQIAATQHARALFGKQVLRPLEAMRNRAALRRSVSQG